MLVKVDHALAKFFFFSDFSPVVSGSGLCFTLNLIFFYPLLATVLVPISKLRPVAENSERDTVTLEEKSSI